MNKQISLATNFPTQFQKESIDFFKHLLPVSSVRFYVIDPHMHLKGFIGGDIDVDIEKEYQENYSDLDPMHPRLFENTDIKIVCSNMLMSMEEWKETTIYQKFFEPRDLMYDTDIFFRHDGKISSVLTLLRNEEMGAFTSEEIQLLENIHPFLEYVLNEIYTPARIDERKYIKEKYHLTSRELDVLEFAMSGSSNKVMAKELNLSLPTIRTHLQHIYDKVEVHSTHELIAKLFRELQ